METTRLSSKGQIVLPKNIRASRSWGPGTRFTIEETSDGILLRPASCFPEADLEDVAGCLRSKRKAKSVAQMHTASKLEVIRRHDRGRY
ncbi:MAG TPA: AbrB/MazE/SpoVT family DNA-binding domain-containing protein [Bryobacteraceae bacterium]|nr:AbrB/MazE/SpoVT family DNA-binding domain-containing protein [Bryobacteraceae bacterium]